MELKLYHDYYKNHIQDYELSEAQLAFTMHPKACIPLSEADGDRSSILALEDDELVSFFVLHRNDGVQPYSANRQAILLRAFSTDHREQGKGYAKRALAQLPQWIATHFTECNEIVLAVNLENIAAQGLYKACGFVDTGGRVMGRKGEQMIMSYAL
ncbi:GNAT family acetyltransferase [Fictibacillus macauensis ZFHKF-1]|uniref:GNAT family acetyltransferase n=1 Tax=Fictibacillus macauensis ZFHKF-1 TaxID=1196324 RepID=I8AJW2_9BACL|nr:GNAT family N-acetyltransferase [Fictibacillus macauensis]EIT86082.1 GNAT family acetyltransferase [Fictibacillus macauensis ZFHKF-1]